MMWGAIGCAASLLLALAAFRRARGAGDFYDDGYGMTPAMHRRYAFAGLGFATLFGLCWLLGTATMAAVLLAPFATIAILYAAMVAVPSNQQSPKSVANPRPATA